MVFAPATEGGGRGAHHWSFRSKKVRAKATISPQIETSESERWKKSRADGAGVGKRCRRSATNWDGTGISKRADLSRTSGFVPIFCTNDLISWKSSDVNKKLACFKSKIQFRRGSTQLFLPRSKSFRQYQSERGAHGKTALGVFGW